MAIMVKILTPGQMRTGLLSFEESAARMKEMIWRCAINCRFFLPFKEIRV